MAADHDRSTYDARSGNRAGRTDAPLDENAMELRLDPRDNAPEPNMGRPQLYRLESPDDVRLLGEAAIEYQPSLSFRLGPDLSSRLRLAAFARRWAPEALAAWLLARGLDQEPDRIRAEAAVEILTPRELDVTRLTAQGKTNHEIAYELGISGETVKSHIRRTLAKLGLHSKSELRLLIQALGPWNEMLGRKPPIQSSDSE